MGDWAVSPTFAVGKLRQGALGDKIDVFEDQVIGWVLNHAAALDAENYALRQHSGIAVLMLVLSYFEQIACYIRGEDSRTRSPEFFQYGLLQVFTDLEQRLAQHGVRDPPAAVTNIANTLYLEARCGLFHEAMIRGRILIRRDNAALGFMIDFETAGVGSVVIDPWLLLARVRAHFQQYLQRLRDPVEVALRENFERFWDQRMGRGDVVLPPPVAPAAPAAPEPG